MGGPSFKVNFNCCIFLGGEISRLTFLTALLGSWPVGGQFFSGPRSAPKVLKKVPKRNCFKNFFFKLN